MYNNDDTSNNGTKSKFQQRLKLIRINRYKKIKHQNNTKSPKNKIKSNISKNNNHLPITTIKKYKGIQENNPPLKNNPKDNLTQINNNIHISTNPSPINQSISKENNSPKNNYTYHYKSKGIHPQNIIINTTKENNNYQEELKLKIIKRIKKNFNKRLSEIEILESELYLLEKNNKEELDLIKVKEIKKELEIIINKINTIIQEYNIYNNYILENIIDINDGLLVDDIIKYRDTLSTIEDQKKFIKDYKLLEEFKNLYLKLDNITNTTNNLLSENSRAIEIYQDRDKKYIEIKNNIINYNQIIKNCDKEIEKQNEYYHQLLKKITTIDTQKNITYKMDGVGELVTNSIKYLGLLMVSPLSGLIPSICINTLATRKMINNIYKNIEIKKTINYEYIATDYEKEINEKIVDIDYTYNLIDDTLILINNLKEDFMKQYNPNIKGYSDTLRKLDNISDKISDNRYKMDIIKKNLVNSKKLNRDKLIKVKTLNNG